MQALLDPNAHARDVNTDFLQTDRQCDTVYFSSSEPQLYLASSLPIYLQTSSGLVLPRLTVVESRSVLVFVLKISSVVQVADLVGQVGRFTSVF